MADAPPAGRLVDRYFAAGLTHNPFVAPSHDDELGPAFADRGLPAPPPAGSRTLVQLIGAAGAGKTSQLRHWREHSPGPYHWIPRAPYRARWVSPPQLADGLAYGDEIDRMPQPLRLRWFREAASTGATLVIGTHRDLTVTARRAGLHVITHRLGRADESLLHTVIAQRLRAAAIGPEAFDFLTPELVGRVQRASDGNLRAADVECHQLLAEHVRTRQ